MPVRIVYVHRELKGSNQFVNLFSSKEGKEEVAGDRDTGGECSDVSGRNVRPDRITKQFITCRLRQQTAKSKEYKIGGVYST